MRVPLAAELVRDHMVVVPDLRGIGRWSRFSEASRKHYAKPYAQPGAMHAGFEQFKAFDQDAIDNKAFVANGKLTIPVLAIGGDKSFGPTMAVVMRAAATNVQELVIPHSGHWLMEEQPNATVAAIRAFLDRKS
jgi:pimeloyl-ACP methyl ester carboxylesterase